MGDEVLRGWGLHVTENVDLWYGHPGSCSHSIHLSRLRPFSFHGEYLGVADQGLKSWIGEVIERSNNTHQLLNINGSERCCPVPRFSMPDIMK